MGQTPLGSGGRVAYRPTVLGVGFRRLFGLGAAALLAVADLIGIVALARGEVGTGPGRFEVEPTEGERLVVRSERA